MQTHLYIHTHLSLKNSPVSFIKNLTTLLFKDKITLNSSDISVSAIILHLGILYNLLFIHSVEYYITWVINYFFLNCIHSLFFITISMWTPCFLSDHKSWTAQDFLVWFVARKYQILWVCFAISVHIKAKMKKKVHWIT